MNPSNIILRQFKTLRNISRKFISTKESIERRNELFSLEQKRQKDKIGRIEKIEVRYLGLPEDSTLVMNKGLSTPYNCAQHFSEIHCKNSALALIDGQSTWDMHRPLYESCTLQFLNFTIPEPHAVNRAFWRTCSFMLGAAVQEAFKDEAQLELHSFPVPNIKSGSFVYDITLAAKDWEPNLKELRAFSAEMRKLSLENLKIERLDVVHELALEMFKESKYKTEQIPKISAQNQGRVTMYRIGNHIDISRGPMIANSNFLGRCTISSVHQIGKEDDNHYLYRVQGVALPTGIIINHFAYGILEERSKKLNPAKLPTEIYDDHTIEQVIV